MKRGAEIYYLANGLRVVHQRLPHSGMVHCGIMVNAGTRHETSNQNGLAHLIEHCSFKGTRHRKPYHILSRIENVGGELDAFTTREKTFYSTAALSRYAERSLELLTDISCFPAFPETEINREKKVIREEIEMYEDIPEESLMDEFHGLLFPENSLGYNILGTSTTLNQLQQKDLNSFHEGYYGMDNMVVMLLGNITPNKVQKLTDRYLKSLSSSVSYNKTESPPPINPFAITKKRQFNQSYCIIGNRAYSRHNPKRFALTILNNILGGAGMSSRLNLELREKKGYVYQIDTTYLPYQDSGIFSIDFSTDPENLNACTAIISKVLDSVRNKKLSKIQLNRAKRQVKAQMAMMQENHNSLLQVQARNLLDYGTIPSFEEFFKNIDKVSPEEVMDVANEILDPDQLSKLVYQPSS